MTGPIPPVYGEKDSSGKPRWSAMTETAHAHGGATAIHVRSVSQDDRFTTFMLRTWQRSPKWFAPLAILVCFGGGVAYTLLLNPTESGAFSSPTCIVKLTTGFDCPGCGGTRAFWYLLHGDLPAAARSHIIAVFAAPFLVYMYVAWAANLVTGSKLPYLRISPKAISVFLAIWAVFTVARNLPWAPFDWLYV
jgi:hypothetical protein